jgi:hypothetical protein
VREFEGKGQMFPPILVLGGESEHWDNLSGAMSSSGCVPVRCETVSAAKGLVLRYKIECLGRRIARW